MFMPQIRLSKKFERHDIRLYSTFSIFRKTGLFDYMFLMTDDIYSMNLRNLNILRAFFIAFLSLRAITAPWIDPFLKAFCISSISEYLIQ